MFEVKLSLDEQMRHAKYGSRATRLELSQYELFPEVVDVMIKKENNPDTFFWMCNNLFFKANSGIWASTLKEAAEKKVNLCGMKDEYDHALCGIALHLNTDVDTLWYLFTLSNHYVNWGLANNPNTPKELLNKLAEINEFNIDEALMYNPNTPEDTCKKVRARYGSFFSCGYWYDLHGIQVEASGN